MRGRDGILVLLVMLAVGALSILGYWVGTAGLQDAEPNRIAQGTTQGTTQGATQGTTQGGEQGTPQGISRATTQSAGGQAAGTGQTAAVAPTAPDEPSAPAAATARAPDPKAAVAPLAAAGRIQAQNAETKTSPAASGAELIGAPPSAGPAAVDAAEDGLGQPRLERRAVDASREKEVPVDAPGRGDGSDIETSSIRVTATPPKNDSQVQSNDQEFDRTSAQPERVAAAAPTEPKAEATDVDDRPSFDLVRVAPDGSTVLAGRAQPGSVVSVLLDGQLAAEVRADRRGEFVALVDAAFSEERTTRSLTLSAKSADGQVLLAAAPVILTRPADPGSAPVAVRPTAQGAVILQPGERVKKDGVSIDAVSYDEKGNVVVAGRGKPGSTTRIYLDNALSAQAQVNPDGQWRVRVAQEIKPAVYRLRVDQLSTRGIVIGRAETPFERAPVKDIVLRAGNVVVQPGNNLWRIASYVYGDGLRYHVIYEGNRAQIRDPDLIYPGQILDLPGAPARRPETESN